MALSMVCKTATVLAIEEKVSERERADEKRELTVAAGRCRCWNRTVCSRSSVVEGSHGGGEKLGGGGGSNEMRGLYRTMFRTPNSAMMNA
jgi:streptolysin S family bacteriocin protoxin